MVCRRFSSPFIRGIQLAYCCNKINDANRINYNWFFGKKSEKEELIELIKRHELD